LEGSVGAGKSHLLKRLSSRGDTLVVTEPDELWVDCFSDGYLKNDMGSRMIDDCMAHMYFLQGRKKEKVKQVFFERSPFGHKYVFNESISRFRALEMIKEQFKVACNLLHGDSLKKRLIIFLMMDNDSLLEAIFIRKRVYEMEYFGAYDTDKVHTVLSNFNARMVKVFVEALRLKINVLIVSRTVNKAILYSNTDNEPMVVTGDFAVDTSEVFVDFCGRDHGREDLTQSMMGF